MFFTQDDYKKIQQWLIKNSVKDTEFNEANIPFNGEETITIVQGNQNKKVFLKDLIAQVFNLGISDFVNITDKYDAPNISLEEAIRLIPSRARKEGQVITFLDREDHWHIYQFKGALNQWNVLDTWEDLFDWEKLIIDSILPDEEDLTKSPADANGNSYLSLKDREYNPEDFSGLGRIILRKNIVDIEDPIYGKVKKNYLYQDMINKENTIYEIRYEFDLNGAEITIPEGCVLDFQGGSFNNGVLDLNKNEVKANSIVFNNIKFKNLIEIKAKHIGIIPNKDCTKEFESIVKTGARVIFDDGDYYFTISELLMSRYTQLEGMSKNKRTRFYITPSKDSDYLLGLNYDCRLLNLDIKLVESEYKVNDIIQINNSFAGNDVTSNYSKYNYGIDNVSISGVWKANHDYNSDKDVTGLHIKVIDIDEKGNKNPAFAISNFPRVNQSEILFCKIGVLIEVKNIQNNQYVWCNSLLFTNIKINAYYGIYFDKENIFSTGYCVFENYMYQSTTPESFGIYGQCDSDRFSNYISWDNYYFGCCWGKILINNVSYNTTLGKELFRGTNNGFLVPEGKKLRINNAFTQSLLFANDAYSTSTSRDVELSFKDVGGMKFTPYKNYRDNLYLEEVLKDAYNIDYTKSLFSDRNKEQAGYSKHIYHNVDEQIELISNFKIREGNYVKNKIGECTILPKTASRYQPVTDYISDQYFHGVRIYKNTESSLLAHYGMYKIRFYIKSDIDIPSDYECIIKNIFINSCILQSTNWGVINASEDTNRHFYIEAVFIPISALTSIRAFIEYKLTNYSNNELEELDITNRSYVEVDEIEFIGKTEGTFNEKPIGVNVGFQYYCTDRKAEDGTSGLVIVHIGGNSWRDTLGRPINDENYVTPKKYGTFANKPSNVDYGFAYYCSDRQTVEGATNGIMIYYKGNNVWVDALGRVVE